MHQHAAGPTLAYSRAISVSAVSPDWDTKMHVSSRKMGQRLGEERRVRVKQCDKPELNPCS